MVHEGAQLLSIGIANKIKRKIIKGEWKTGEQLPNEQMLSEELKVSRTTIREAVKILVSKNILRIRRGKGTFVDNTPGLADDPLGLEFVPENIMVQHLCEFRFALEPHASEMAARRATEKQIREMRKIVSAMGKLECALVEAPEKDKDRILDRFAGLDADFHSLLYAMTQNTVFQRLSAIINNTVVENYATELYRRRRQRLRFSDAHETLFKAIEARDEEQAMNLSREHMRIMREELCREIGGEST